MDFEFIETAYFTKRLCGVLSDEAYAKLQEALILRPEAGAIIPGTKGIRKLRWSLADRGKRGGVRVLYYLVLSDHEIYMLYLFKKSERADLERDQLKALSEYIEKFLKKRIENER